jgi:hypothetical protein
MNEMKNILRQGIEVFETYESDTIEKGSERLVEIARQVPGVLEAYYDRVVSGIQSLE